MEILEGRGRMGAPQVTPQVRKRNYERLRKILRSHSMDGDILDGWFLCLVCGRFWSGQRVVDGKPIITKIDDKEMDKAECLWYNIRIKRRIIMWNYPVQSSTLTWQGKLSKETAVEYFRLVVNQIVRDILPEDIIDDINDSGSSVSVWAGSRPDGDAYPVDVNYYINDRGLYDKILGLSREKDSFRTSRVQEAFHVETSAGTIYFFAPPGEAVGDIGEVL